MAKLTQAILLVMLATGENIAFGANEALLKESRDYLEKGETKAAAIQLKNYLQEAPENGEARVLLGEVYIRLGDGVSAIKELEKARDLNVPKAKWIVSLAQAYLLKNDGKTLLRQIEPDPALPAAANAKLQALRGMAQLTENQADKAEESFNTALKSDPNSPDALLGLSLLNLSKKQYQPAVDFAAQSVAKDPKFIQGWAILGEGKRLSGDLPAARDAFSHAIELQPLDVKARLGRASVYIAMENLAEAQKDVDAVRKTAGDVPMALYMDGVIAFQSRKYQEAEDLLTKVNSSMPGHMPTLFLLGSIAYQQEELRSAENYLSDVVKIAPEHLAAVKLLAATHLKLGHAKETIDLLKPWADKEHKDPQIFAILGSAYMKEKKFDQGIESLSRAAELAPDLAAVRAELGLGRIAAGKTEQGLVDLKSAIDLDPNLVQADVTSVLIMIQQKKFDEAIAMANKLKDKRKDDPMPLNVLGTAYMAKGEAEKAREQWRKALAMKADYTPANLNLAKLALSQRKPEEAVKEYDNVLKRDAGNLSALIGLAQIAEQAKDYAKMEKHLENAREKNPKEVLPAIMLTRYYLSQNKGMRAIEIAREAQGASPDNPSALQNLGQAEMGANQGSNAVVSFKKLVSKLPENPEAHHLLAQALFKTGDKKAAVQEWDEALRLAPEFVPALLAKAELAMQDKQFGEVMKTAELIKNRFPQSPLGFQLEGDVHSAQKQFEKALSAYDKAFQQAPSSSLARRLFLVRRELHKNDEAIAGLEKWLETAKNDVEAWFLLGEARQATGQSKPAILAYEKAHELQPDNLAILNNLAWLYQEVGDERALALAEKMTAASAGENKTEILDTIGWIFLHNGKQDKGLVLLQQAVMQEPGNIPIRLHLAEAFEKNGKKEEAKKELGRLLKDDKPFPERSKAEALLKQWQ
ncbi:MAG: PEP-CTERM system TPR-repeat protein PrsT [Methylococcaceae bacterium]|nr:PEP-CTERM system TPR-repeat protein PrsT [Methylococcaceae bacterium]